MNSKTIYPVKKEETLRDFLVKKNLNDIPKKEYTTIFDGFFSFLLKATRFNDISDLISNRYEVILQNYDTFL